MGWKMRQQQEFTAEHENRKSEGIGEKVEMSTYGWFDPGTEYGWIT